MLISNVHKSLIVINSIETRYSRNVLKSRSINSRVGFYRGIKPRGEARWLYTPIKPSRPFIQHYFTSNFSNGIANKDASCFLKVRTRRAVLKLFICFAKS